MNISDSEHSREQSPEHAEPARSSQGAAEATSPAERRPGNGAAESPALARAVVAALAEHVSDVVLCPGSRNSPLALALLAEPRVRVHVRIDERSAAFLALGMARVQGRHVGVVMTSGTAVANTLPAMVEAFQSNTPLAVISADRPRRFVGTGASQTIDQVGLFGVYAETTGVVAEGDVEKLHPAFDRLQVHINVEFDTPLVPDALPESATSEPAAAAVQRPEPSTAVTRVNHGEATLDLSKNTLVIAGDGAWEVDGLEDVPTISEPSAPAPYHPVHPVAAGVFVRGGLEGEGNRLATKPEQLVVVGHPTLHRPVLALMADPEIDLTVLSRTEHPTDPTGNARRVATTVKTTCHPTKQWLDLCEAASMQAAEAVRSSLLDAPFTGMHAAAAVADSLGEGDVLFVGASNPVRDASFVGLPFAGVRTISPRGAAGIDGSISQATGVALAVQSAHPEEPRAPRTVALLGDLTFLHDAGGLLIGPGEPRPENLTIVVANDDGGGIFESLEVGQPALRGSFERAFGTPHGVDIGELCAAYGVSHCRVESAEELVEALDQALLRDDPSSGVHVIEARTDRSARRGLSEAITAKVVH